MIFCLDRSRRRLGRIIENCSSHLLSLTRHLTLCHMMLFGRSWVNLVFQKKNMVNVITSFHQDMKVSVQSGNDQSDPFYITNYRTQGCVLDPPPFFHFTSLPGLRKHFRTLVWALMLTFLQVDVFKSATF